MKTRAPFHGLGLLVSFGLLLPSLARAGESDIAIDPPAADTIGAIATVPPPNDDQIKTVTTSTVRIDFELRSDADAVTGVELWTTIDLAATWQQAKIGTQRRSPIQWHAETDGLYGIYLIVRNKAGASSPPPTAGTAPQQWLMIDTASPTVQVLSARKGPSFDINRHLEIRWKAEDRYLTDRPITLYYKQPKDVLFTPIEAALSNDGTYRWVVPDSLQGEIIVKVAANDLAGHIGESVSSAIELSEQTRAARPSAKPRVKEMVSKIGSALDEAAGAMAREASNHSRDNLTGRTAKSDDTTVGNETASTDDTATGDDASARTPAAAAIPSRITNDPPAATDNSGERRRAAIEKYERGTWHRTRGEWELAEERYREALEIDAKYTAARHDLAGVLFKQRRYDDAADEYRKILLREPDHWMALRGLALVQATQKQYRSSFETLQRLVTVRPDDPEIWLGLGDVTMFMGDRAAARNAWNKAAGLAGSTPELVDRAKKRLALYPAETSP